MGKYGRFEGGEHFKYLKKYKNVNHLKYNASKDQINTLKQLGLDKIPENLSKARAKQLIVEIKGKKKSEKRNNRDRERTS